MVVLKRTITLNEINYEFRSLIPTVVGVNESFQNKTGNATAWQDPSPPRHPYMKQETNQGWETEGKEEAPTLH